MPCPGHFDTQYYPSMVLYLRSHLEKKQFFTRKEFFWSMLSIDVFFNNVYCIDAADDTIHIR